MDKVVRDGKVAVLYSPGFGAGWFSWNSEHSECLFDSEIVNAVLDGDRDKAKALAEAKWPEGYWGGAHDLEVEWLPQGTAFEVDEYDGNEGIRVADRIHFQVA